MAWPVRARNSLCVSASSGAEPEMASRSLRHWSLPNGGLAEQAGVEGRHAHDDGGARHQAHEGGELELRHPQDARGVEQRGVQGDEQAVHVEDRQRMQQHVARHEAPVGVQRLGVGGDVAMRDHGALGAAGGAGGVDQRGEIVGAARRPLRACGFCLAASCAKVPEPSAAMVSTERDLVGLGGALDLGDALGGDDDHGRLGVADEIFELGSGVGGVERIEDGADLEGGQVEEDVG